MATDNEEGALSPNEAAQFLSVSTVYLQRQRQRDRNLIRDGKKPEGPPFLMLSRNRVRYRKSELVKWLKKKEQEEQDWF